MKLVKILTMMNNPWFGLSTLSKIRIKDSINYNVFWIVDALNQYGLMIQCDEDFIYPKEIKLKGIQIKVDNTTAPNQLILILKEMKDWELFYVLCNDLINVMKGHDEVVIEKVMKRLERWQKLLQKTSLKIMSKEEQMGLFGELKILNDYIIPAYGNIQAIHSWVGALGDKQDFLLGNLAIEVKSFRLTSGNYVWISSKEQLNSEKTPLFLFACGLNEVSTGKTIVDLIETIALQIETENVLNEFIEKIEQYGYVSELQKDDLSKFKLEKVNGFEVKEEFPRISLNQVSSLIKDMKYSVDLSGCSQFKVNIPDILI
ncbi:PD-(D/E)XK motif protein [Bacillus sp. NEB1478]|uniref:PD-(D/E)XK motif protein n=1 Tax=Bacillus sp. NEB1478 TaxID=3073816 RepID=UPI002873E97B|nr:PD-(D/E)XK motif protein [Bacillus sp. NEB1478]WNB90934.1 PD-(D/E)XK motif protein [Bacillus sp. NEB1478]